MKLYLLRHPRPVIEPGTCYGQLDIPACTEHLPIVAAKWQQELAGAAVVSSPLQRCRVLAEALCTDGALRFNPDLQELNFGQWEGQRWDDIDRQQLTTWSEQLLDYSPGGAESLADLVQRVERALNQSMAQAQNQPQVWVTHAGVIRVVLAKFLKMNQVDGVRLGLDYGSLSCVQWSAAGASQVCFINR